MNDERDMAPMVWGYIKSRETARRMDAYAGEVENMVCTITRRLDISLLADATLYSTPFSTTIALLVHMI